MKTKITYTGLSDCEIGLTKLIDPEGEQHTYVGKTEDGSVVLQQGDSIKAITQVTFDVMGFEKPFEQIVLTRYIDERNFNDLTIGVEDLISMEPQPVESLEGREDSMYEVKLIINEIKK